MDALQHTYPPDYPPGTHWALDEAWAILDTFRPGGMTDDMRSLLAGMITGTLLRLAREGRLAPPRRGEQAAREKGGCV